MWPITALVARRAQEAAVVARWNEPRQCHRTGAQ